MTELNVKPLLADDTILKVPAIVNVCILIANVSPVNVIIILAGITIEQVPNGTIPLPHVAESLNEPDATATNTEIKVLIVTIAEYTVLVLCVEIRKNSQRRSELLFEYCMVTTFCIRILTAPVFLLLRAYSLVAILRMT